MVAPSLFKFLAPPRYLALNPVGLDISDQSVKFCRLTYGRRGLRVVALGERALSAGLIERGRVLDGAKLSEALRGWIKDFGSRFVYASLPEELGYVVKMGLPALKPVELRQSIELQLEEYVPLPATGVVFDYEVIHAPAHVHDGYDLAVSVFPKEMAEQYTQALAGAGLAPLGLVIEAQAIARSLLKRGSEGAALLIDVGKTRTGLFVTVGTRVVLTSTVDQVGGDLINRAVERGLSVSREEAIKLKREHGLLQSGDGKVLNALLPAVSVLRDEVGKFYDYWRAHEGGKAGNGGALKRIILCGGEAALPGLVEYLGSGLDVPVELGNVWTNIIDTENVVPPLPLTESLRYATALGLALRPFNHLPL